MKRLMLITFTALLTQISFAQTDTDGHYWIYYDSIASKFPFTGSPTASSQDQAFEAPASILTLNGPWHNYSIGTDGGRRCLKIDKNETVFKTDGTAFLKQFCKTEQDFQHVKNITLVNTIPYTWKKIRDNLSITMKFSNMTVNYASRDEIINLSSREKYDMDSRIKQAENDGRRAGAPTANVRVLKFTPDIIMWNTTAGKETGLISHAALNKLLEERSKYMRRHPEEQ